MSFQGSLERMKLPEIIQLVAVTGKTGKFAIDSVYGKGTIYLQDGEIIHAETDGKVDGENALYMIAIWDQGKFLFHPDEHPDTLTIEKNNTALLMEIAKRLDEWKILHRKLDSLNDVPEKLPNPSQIKISNLSQGESDIYNMIDGQLNLSELSSIADLEILTLAKYVFGLLSMKLITIR